jgi:hypothetical protein
VFKQYGRAGIGISTPAKSGKLNQGNGAAYLWTKIFPNKPMTNNVEGDTSFAAEDLTVRLVALGELTHCQTLMHQYHDLGVRSLVVCPKIQMLRLLTTICMV